jgi:beta-galactosidase
LTFFFFFFFFFCIFSQDYPTRTILTRSCHSTNLLSAGTLDIPTIAPGTSGKVALGSILSAITSDKEVLLTVTFTLKDAAAWAEAGHEIAWFQHAVSTVTPATLTSTSSLSRLSSKLSVTKTKPCSTTIAGKHFAFTFDAARGLLTSWTAGSKLATPLLEADPATGAALSVGFWRPPTDNCIPASVPMWELYGVNTLTSQLRSFTVTEGPDSISVVAKTFITPPILGWGYETTTTYTISSTGTLSVAVHATPTGPAPKHVPRAGLNLRLPKSLSAVKWHGLGPGESYPDKQSAQRVGVWSVNDVSDLHTPYEVPQEGGNRMGVRWASVSEGQGSGIRAVAGPEEEWSSPEGRMFSFHATRYADSTVQKAAHPCDLFEEDATLVRLDATVAGVGTATCGPGVREDLLVATKEMKWSFILEAFGV